MALGLLNNRQRALAVSIKRHSPILPGTIPPGCIFPVELRYTGVMGIKSFLSVNKSKYLSAFLLICLIGGIVGGCSSGEGGQPDWAPAVREDWPVSTPREQGLNPVLVNQLYQDASELDTLYGLLLVKNGHLVAEEYFNGGEIDARTDLASVTKSFTSALMGIALEECYLDGVDQRMIEFFPAYKDKLDDPRKAEITIEQMLQMRSGYPWEEFTYPYLNTLFSSPDWLPFLVEFPLTSDPGTQFAYSNLTAHLTGVIVAKSCATGLAVLVEDYILGPIDAQMGTWAYDPNGFNYGSGSLALTARDAARFGRLYLENGVYQGWQVIPRGWVEKSLARYSTGIYNNRLGKYLVKVGYGYFWWSAKAGKHEFNYAWGHGGNLIVLVHDLDLVIVTTADTLPGLSGDESWEKEGAIIDVVGKFIKSLPAE
jgi:CubicO group peptidase (beta-lactamase class C family)